MQHATCNMQPLMKTRLYLSLFIIVLLLVACGGDGINPAQEPTPIPPVQALDEIIADAVVVPATRANLSMSTGGTIGELLVAEGEAVEAGQLLLRVDAPRLEATLTQAEATLAQAEAGLAQAESAHDRAVAALDKLNAGARPEEIAGAQAAVAVAQANLQRLQDGASGEDIQAARAQVTIAEAELARVRRGADESQRINAQANVERAERAVQQAQAAYDLIRDLPDAGASPQALQLEQATIDYEAAKAQYDDVLAGATAEDITIAEANIAAAQANLNQVLAAARPADLAAAQAEVDRAQAQLDLIRAGSTAEDVRIAESDVASARASVEAAEANVAVAQSGVTQAQVALEETLLTAPFAGTVALITPQLGEQVAPGQPIVQIADFSTWQIETDDLTELNIVYVQEGAPATFKVDALPDEEFTGTVTRIRPFGENNQGDITYTVIVTPDQQDMRLKWNMTAAVTISTPE
jgi:HlyD family secretion protein